MSAITKAVFGKKNPPPSPPPRAAAPKKSEAEVTADASRDRALRAEQYASRKKKRKKGRSLLIYDDEQGVSNTLG